MLALGATVTFLAAFLASTALARTDLSGCVSSETVKYGGASLLWYVPGTGEICEFLDCGGGRAPPKTTVAGCAAYSGTATYSPSYLPGFGAGAVPSSTVAPVATTASASPVTSTAATVTETSDTTASTGLATLGGTTSRAKAGITSSSGQISSSATISGSASPSTAGGAIVTVGPFGMIVGFAAGVAAMI